MLVACGSECREDDTLGKAMRFEGTALLDDFVVIVKRIAAERTGNK